MLFYFWAIVFLNHSKLIIRSFSKSFKSLIRIRIEKQLDPDLHWKKQLDPDPQDMKADPQPWLKV